MHGASLSLNQQPRLRLKRAILSAKSPVLPSKIRKVPVFGFFGYSRTIEKDAELLAGTPAPFFPGLMVVDGDGTVSYRRSSTELPPGKTVAELWSEQVRAALDQAL